MSISPRSLAKNPSVIQTQISGTSHTYTHKHTILILLLAMAEIKVHLAGEFPNNKKRDYWERKLKSLKLSHVKVVDKIENATILVFPEVDFQKKIHPESKRTQAIKTALKHEFPIINARWVYDSVNDDDKEADIWAYEYPESVENRKPHWDKEQAEKEVTRQLARDKQWKKWKADEGMNKTNTDTIEEEEEADEEAPDEPEAGANKTGKESAKDNRRDEEARRRRAHESDESDDEQRKQKDQKKQKQTEDVADDAMEETGDPATEIKQENEAEITRKQHHLTIQAVHPYEMEIDEITADEVPKVMTLTVIGRLKSNYIIAYDPTVRCLVDEWPKCKPLYAFPSSQFPAIDEKLESIGGDYIIPVKSEKFLEETQKRLHRTLNPDILTWIGVAITNRGWCYSIVEIPGVEQKVAVVRTALTKFWGKHITEETIDTCREAMLQPKLKDSLQRKAKSQYKPLSKPARRTRSSAFP